jgi:ribosome-associated protein
MDAEEVKKQIASSEFMFSASRSRGPGGQNVNKVNTRVELRFNISSSSGLSEQEKERIFLKLKNRISSEGDLIIVSQSERTQLMNRKKVEEKFFRLLAEALTEKPQRKPTRATEASKVKRIEKKKKRGMIKKLRKVSGTDEV